MSVKHRNKFRVCPECKNEGWKGPRDPILIYKTDNIGTIKIRYWVCRNCNFQGKTSVKEEFMGPVDVNYNKKG